LFDVFQLKEKILARFLFLDKIFKRQANLTNVFMGRIYNNIVETVGRTPLVKLNQSHPPACPPTILLKCEYFNPLGSVKDRIGMAMIEGRPRSEESSSKGHRHHRADERQTPHCTRIRRGGQGLPRSF